MRLWKGRTARSNSAGRRPKTGTPLVMLRVAFDQVNLIKSETL